MSRSKKRLGMALKLAGLAAVALSIVLALQLSQEKSAGAHNIQATLVAGNSGKCLAIHPSHFFNGAVAYQWTCGDSNNVEILDAGGGFHFIRFTHSGKCLTVNGYAWWDGGTLDQWDCLGQSNQKWTGNFFGNVFEVHASQANPNKCITVHGESTANGAIVNQWQCLFQANQAWNAVGRGVLPTATPTRTATPDPDGEGTLRITKLCDPTSDPGEFTIRIDGVSQGTIGCGEQLGPIELEADTYRVSEVAGPNTNLNNYERSFSGDCDSDGDVAISDGENATCTIHNERNPTPTPTLTPAP